MRAPVLRCVVLASQELYFLTVIYVLLTPGDMENYSPQGERYKPSLTTAEPYMAEGVEKAEREGEAERDRQAEINRTVPPSDQGVARVSRVSRQSEPGG